MFLNSLPFASLPALDGTLTMPWKRKILHASDVGTSGVLVYADGDSGGFWRPLNTHNRLICDIQDYTHTGTLNATKIPATGDGAPLNLPANFLYPGDQLVVTIGATKTDTQGSIRFRLYYGASATMTANPEIWNSGLLAAANVEFGFVVNIRHYFTSPGVDGAVRVMGTGNATDQFGGATTTAHPAGDVTVHEWDVVAGKLFLGCTLGDVDDSVVLRDYNIDLIAGYAV